MENKEGSEKNFSQEIVNKIYPEAWSTSASGLGVEFDFDKYPEILKRLQECVNSYISSHKKQGKQ